MIIMSSGLAEYIYGFFPFISLDQLVCMCIHVYGYMPLIFCVCISRLIYMLVYVSLHMFKLVRVHLGMCIASVNCVCAHVKSAVRLHKQSHIW